MPAVKTSPSIPPAPPPAPRSVWPPGHEVVHRESCAGLAAAEQVAHVVADPGYAEEARFLVEDGFDVLGREPQHLKEIKNRARIDRSRPGSHAEPVERGKPECAVHAPAVFQRAQTGAAAQMGDDHTPESQLWRHAGSTDAMYSYEGRGTRSAARRPGKCRGAAERSRPRQAGRDESWCRSRRPAARRGAVPTRPQSRPG